MNDQVGVLCTSYHLFMYAWYPNLPFFSSFFFLWFSGTKTIVQRIKRRWYIITFLASKALWRGAGTSKKWNTIILRPLLCKRFGIFSMCCTPIYGTVQFWDFYFIGYQLCLLIFFVFCAEKIASKWLVMLCLFFIYKYKSSFMQRSMHRC